MKLVSYHKDGTARAALLVGEQLYDTATCCPGGPVTMQELLEGWARWHPLLLRHQALLNTPAGVPGLNNSPHGIPLNSVALLAPVPYPTSCRDGYAFRQHVATARRNRHADWIPAFDQFPVLYFTNHRSIVGPGPVLCMPDHFDQLDFELEAAVVICRPGRNIRAKDADAHIGGLMIMNDLSARRLQQEEMLLNLGPFKGKDFATALGPWLVTLDELRARTVAPKPGHSGTSWNLEMRCRVNGVEVSRGNLADMDWTFAELIERASYGATLYPGDVIGSGTVGTGCFLELNGTAKLHDPTHQEQWLCEGDRVELEIDCLGVLTNTILREETDWSLLKLKKEAAAPPSSK